MSLLGALYLQLNKFVLNSTTTQPATSLIDITTAITIGSFIVAVLTLLITYKMYDDSRKRKRVIWKVAAEKEINVTQSVRKGVKQEFPASEIVIRFENAGNTTIEETDYGTDSDPIKFNFGDKAKILKEGTCIVSTEPDYIRARVEKSFRRDPQNPNKIILGKPWLNSKNAINFQVRLTDYDRDKVNVEYTGLVRVDDGIVRIRSLGETVEGTKKLFIYTLVFLFGGEALGLLLQRFLFPLVHYKTDPLLYPLLAFSLVLYLEGLSYGAVWSIINHRIGTFVTIRSMIFSWCKTSLVLCSPFIVIMLVFLIYKPW